MGARRWWRGESDLSTTARVTDPTYRVTHAGYGSPGVRSSRVPDEWLAHSFWERAMRWATSETGVPVTPVELG